MNPPKAPQQLSHSNIHMVSRLDPFRWLKNRDDPAVIEYLKAENAFTDAMLLHTHALQTQLKDELAKQIPAHQSTAPYPSGQWMRYARISAEQDYWVHCRTHANQEEILLDENERASEASYYHLEDLTLSPDCQYLAWTEDITGDERFNLWIKDLNNNTHVGLIDCNIKWSLAWLDATHLVYILGDHADRPFRIKIHTIGTSFNEDQTIWTETDERFHLSVERTRNGRAVICRSESKSSSEIRLLQMNEQISLTTVHTRQENHKYDVSLGENTIFIRSNHEHTEYALYTLTPIGLKSIYIPDSTQYPVTIEDVDVMSNHLICWTRRNGIQELIILNHSGSLLGTLQFPDPCYEIYPDVNVEPDTHLFRLRYSSLSTPDRVLEYNLNSGTHRVIKTFDIPGVHSDVLRCERHWATSFDGTRIPISLVKHIDTPNNAPCILHGYGAYGVSYSTGFYEDWMPLLNRGWVMAIAHVRGGGELGREWYEQGKLKNKRNSFFDLIACTEYLKAQCISNHVIISGGSAGGLLVAATLNLRPDLFDGCIAEVPFVDVTNTMLDPDLPLTIIEYEEWGNPNQIDDFQTIQSYDPYEQYTGQYYPPVFATAGLWDPRVGFWEPAKWIAKIRHHHPDSSHILFTIDLDSGHSGRSGRQKIIEENARKYAFVLNSRPNIL